MPLRTPKHKSDKEVTVLFGLQCYFSWVPTSECWCSAFSSVFLNRRAAARYRALTSIIPVRERLSWNLSF